jgi:lipopolysaccharide heptosyltransferase I
MEVVMTKLLIIKLSAIGDVVQTLPALEAIKQAIPDSEIHWVVEETAAGILDGHPLIDRLLVSRRTEWLRMLRNPATFAAGVRGFCGFLRELRATRYDIAIDFQGLFKSGILIGLLRSERKVGFAGQRELSSLFLNERLPAYHIEKHALERYLDVARYLGAVDPKPACTLPIEAERAAVRTRLGRELPPGKKVVVINPLARWRTKLWTEARFAELADRLIRERNAAIVFTGGVGDRDAVGRIRGMMREQALDWSGDTTLKELAALAQLADLFISTDTGPMHLAAAAGGRVMALFGPTAPWRTGPYGAGHTVIRKGLDCSPCFSRACSIGIICMTGITVDEVLEQIRLPK